MLNAENTPEHKPAGGNDQNARHDSKPNQPSYEVQTSGLSTDTDGGGISAADLDGASLPGVPDPTDDSKIMMAPTPKSNSANDIQGNQMTSFTRPLQSDEELARLGTTNLEGIIAIDSQSDESSTTIPSSEGQRTLSNYLQKFFDGLGYKTEQDQNANLLVTIPPKVKEAPAVALIVHMDTAKGTQAVDALAVIKNWDGSRVDYPRNKALNVTAANYPELEYFKGHDILHGPGDFPIGFDDKLGLAQLMTLAQVLHSNPAIQHGEIILAFRPDEEIGRMEAVEGLAAEFEARGIRYGYTIDGLKPFEVNVENFNASMGKVAFEGKELVLSTGVNKLVDIALTGVTAHGATAKSEGYLNSTTILLRVMEKLGEKAGIIPVSFETDGNREVDARLTFLCSAPDEAGIAAVQAQLSAALTEAVDPHRWKGAAFRAEEARALDCACTDGVLQAVTFVRAFLAAGPQPLLAEESEGFQGYSNPHAINTVGQRVVLSFRLRAFERQELDERELHLKNVFDSLSPNLVAPTLDIKQQYINMGPELKKFPELVEWARQALDQNGLPFLMQPIRGGTGVDPFVARGIPLANLGTGYFAPESEKEITSRQNIAQHTLWLSALVQTIAQSKRS